ncbi:hypothetical protein D3C87_825120 [compost metagenome]
MVFHAEQDDLGALGGLLRYRQHQGIVGVEHDRALAVLDQETLDPGEVFEGLGAVLAEVIVVDVEHRRDIAGLEAEPALEEAATSGFEHRRLDRGVGEDGAGRPVAGAIAPGDALAVEVDALGGGHAGADARLTQGVADHERGGSLAVGAGHRVDRDGDGSTGRVEHVDDGCAHVMRLALGGVLVHADARRRVDLDDGSALLVEGNRDIHADHVDAGDVEADLLGGPDAERGVLGVDDLGEVDGRAAGREVGVLTKEDDLAGGGDGVRIDALLGKDRHGPGIELEAGQGLEVAVAAAGVQVGDVHELADGVLPVADDLRGNAAGDGDHLIADDQHPVVLASDELLDQHRAAVLTGPLEGLLDLFGGR